MYCEDYPCCGHTPLDPCEPQWYDAPGAFDTSVNPHALCDHENFECDVDPEWDDDDAEWEDDFDQPEDAGLDTYWEERLTTLYEG